MDRAGSSRSYNSLWPRICDLSGKLPKEIQWILGKNNNKKHTYCTCTLSMYSLPQLCTTTAYSTLNVEHGKPLLSIFWDEARVTMIPHNTSQHLRQDTRRNPATRRRRAKLECTVYTQRLPGINRSSFHLIYAPPRIPVVLWRPSPCYHPRSCQNKGPSSSQRMQLVLVCRPYISAHLPTAPDVSPCAVY